MAKCESSDRDIGKGKLMNEIMFIIEDADEGGYIARALGASIFTEADSLEELHGLIRDAVRCHFDGSILPRIIRLHFIREEVIAV
jgi:hypothetical protein